MKTNLIVIKNFLFAILMLGASLSSEAQQRIGIGGNGVTVSSNPVCKGDTFSYSLWVKNKGNQAIVADTIQLRGNFITSGIGLRSIETVVLPTFTLNVGDSVYLTFSDFANNPNYIANTNNIIVIWPAIFGIASTDFDTIKLQVDSCVVSGIEMEVGRKPQVFFDPPSSQLFFFSETEISFAEIMDVNGRLILVWVPQKPAEPLPNLSVGIYFIRAQFVDGRNNVFRFVKRE